MEPAGGYGAGKAGGVAFDPVAFFTHPRTVLRLMSWVSLPTPTAVPTSQCAGCRQRSGLQPLHPASHSHRSCSNTPHQRKSRRLFFFCGRMSSRSSAAGFQGVGDRHRFCCAACGWSSGGSLACVDVEPLYVWMELLPGRQRFALNGAALRCGAARCCAAVTHAQCAPDKQFFFFFRWWKSGFSLRPPLTQTRNSIDFPSFYLSGGNKRVQSDSRGDASQHRCLDLLSDIFFFITFIIYDAANLRF